MAKRGASLSLVGVFGLLAYLTSPSSPIPLGSFLPSSINLFGMVIPTSYFILAVGFLPIALGLLPSDDTDVRL